MSLGLAGDLGKNGLGLSAWQAGRLIWCGYIPNPWGKYTDPEPSAWMALARAAWEHRPGGQGPSLGDMPWAWMAVEIPQVYDRDDINKNDLVTLGCVGGTLVGWFRPPTASGYLPRQWKGQAPKSANHYQISRKVTDRERAVVIAGLPGPEKLGKDVVDAVGIGLHHVIHTTKERPDPKYYGVQE